MIAETQTIPDGRPGTLKTLREMERLVQAGKKNPAVRSQMIREALRGVPERNSLREIQAIIQWVRRRVRYVRDPDTIELIQAADTTLKVGHGDCDDFVILARSALESVGYPTRSKVVGPDPENYAHVFLEVYDPKGRRWVSIDPIAKDKPFGWAPLARASEVYPNMGDHTAIMTGHPLRYRERKTHQRLIGMGINPLWLDQRAEAALLIHEMNYKPGNYGPTQGAKGLTMQTVNMPWRWSGLGGYVVADRRGWRSSVGLGGLGAEFGPDATEAARSKFMAESGKYGFADAIYTGKSTQKVLGAAHIAMLHLMQKYGGGALLRSSQQPGPNGVWRWPSYAGAVVGPCGPEACTDAFQIGKGNHAWLRVEDATIIQDEVLNPQWYKFRAWGGKDRSGAYVRLWDETGGPMNWALWAYMMDVSSSDLPGLPAGYVEDAKTIVNKFFGAVTKYHKDRLAKKKRQARVVQYSLVGVGALAAVVTGGLAASALGALGATKAAAIVGGTTVKGLTALGATVGGVGLQKEVQNAMKKVGISAQQVAISETLAAEVPKVASNEPGATTGDAKLDQVIRELAAQKMAELENQILRQKLLAVTGNNSSSVTVPQVPMPVIPQGFAPQAAAVAPLPDTAEKKGGLGTGGIIAISVGAAALLLGGILLMRR